VNITLAARCGQAQGAAVLSHRSHLTSEDSQITPGEGAASQYETSGLVLGIHAQRFGLIDAPFEHSAGAGGAPTLQAAVRQFQPSPRSSIEQVLVVVHFDRDIALESDESDAVRGQS